MNRTHGNLEMGAFLKSPPAVVGAFSMRVAIVENDPDQAAVLSRWLKLAGHRCHHFCDGSALMKVLDQVGFDALLLDWSRPSALEVLRRIRASDHASLAVLLLSRRSGEDDVVSALRQGADDYLVKPVRQLELVARLEAIARRGKYPVEGSSAIEVGTLRVDRGTRIVWRNGCPVEMTSKELELALLFLSNIGRLLSRGYLLGSVWGTNGSGLSRTLDTHISRLRKKLGMTPEHGWRLMPIYARGYRLDRIRNAQLAYDADQACLRPLPFPASSSALGRDEMCVDERFAGVVPEQLNRGIRKEGPDNRAGALQA